MKTKTIIIDGHIITRRTIVEADLIAIETARARRAVLEAQLQESMAVCKTLEDDVMLRLKAGARVVGRLTAIVERFFGPRRPAWKDMFLDHMAAAHGASRDGLEQDIINKCVGEPKDKLVVGVKPGKAS